MSFASYVSSPSQAAKALTIAIALAVMFLHTLSVDPRACGLSVGAHWSMRLTYAFFHVSVIHLLLNLWCLYTVVFRYDLSVFHIFAAYVVSVCAPDVVLSSIPTVGLSAVCMALTAFASRCVASPLRWHLYMGVLLGVGFLLPSVNAGLHLYAYLAGLLLAYIPCLSWIRRR